MNTPKIQQRTNSLATQFSAWSSKPVAVDVMGGYGPGHEPQVSMELSGPKYFEVTMSAEEVATLHYMLGETMRAYKIEERTEM
ncbi:hypothetical protein C1Y63_10510 [Corynebacterium sp. 13CS0277]|uniref:hypothetical protein n=1 Tax=Corynebacterium sp. 13CS0277 TaxID=2071994 RepID=UPI000D03EFF1|nr:hypothetical protein [Corynebacterium sp. 13CS0277]PRQ10618.1 hypothetical protein C1Y63_10510 [Corynebacterium sp. 13CS0277]